VEGGRAPEGEHLIGGGAALLKMDISYRKGPAGGVQFFSRSAGLPRMKKVVQILQRDESSFAPGESSPTGCVAFLLFGAVTIMQGGDMR